MRKIHGLTNHKLYWVHHSMNQRCYNPNHPAYKYYGYNHIRVCIRWRRNFKSFYNWAIANGYKEGLEIDRIDNHSNYTPSNCRFVTHSKNICNRSISKNNQTGSVGVHYYKSRKKYISYVNGKQLGYYQNILDAVKARDNYIIKNNLHNKLSDYHEKN